MGAYTRWKSWSADAAPTFQYSAYAEEVARARLAPGARILEIGFAEGTFLDWARTHGFDCVGVEINPDLVASARARGHMVFCGRLRDTPAFRKNQYDAVVMLDVLEHIPLDDILSLFDDLVVILRPNGTVIARFPNGGSPFGRVNQYGDATHVTVLTGRSLEQIGLATGFELVGQYNAARGTQSRGGGARNNRILRSAAFLMRDIGQLMLSLAYFGKIIPMDPNITVILRRHSNG